MKTVLAGLIVGWGLWDAIRNPKPSPRSRRNPKSSPHYQRVVVRGQLDRRLKAGKTYSSPLEHIAQAIFDSGYPDDHITKSDIVEIAIACIHKAGGSVLDPKSTLDEKVDEKEPGERNTKIDEALRVLRRMK
jgi:hypothetical protein